MNDINSSLWGWREFSLAWTDRFPWLLRPGIIVPDLILWIIISKVLNDELHWVLWSLLAHFCHGLQQNRHNCLIEVLSDGHVLERVWIVIYNAYLSPHVWRRLRHSQHWFWWSDSLWNSCRHDALVVWHLLLSSTLWLSWSLWFCLGWRWHFIITLNYK